MHGWLRFLFDTPISPIGLAWEHGWTGDLSQGVDICRFGIKRILDDTLPMALDEVWRRAQYHM